MNTILILTDFSDNAAHAATSGLFLSGKLNADILLFNTYLKFSETFTYAGGSVLVDDLVRWKAESSEKLDKLAEKLTAAIALVDTQQGKPSIFCRSDEGNLGSNVESIIKQRDIELVVMGARSGSTIEHVFFGSDTGDVIQQSTRPVLVISPEAEIKQLKKVVFATDFEEADMKALNYLVKLGELFHFAIEIIHVVNPAKKDETKGRDEIDFIKKLGQLQYPGITYTEIGGTDVITRLNRLCTEDGPELLALVHHRHSFLMRILHQSTTAKALSNQTIPLLIFPSGME